MINIKKIKVTGIVLIILGICLGAFIWNSWNAFKIFIHFKKLIIPFFITVLGFSMFVYSYGKQEFKRYVFVLFLSIISIVVFSNFFIVERLWPNFLVKKILYALSLGNGFIISSSYFLISQFYLKKKEKDIVLYQIITFILLFILMNLVVFYFK